MISLWQQMGCDKMRRFFCDPQDISVSGITLFGQDAEHITRVLRLTPGDEIVVCDGACQDYICRITSVSRTKVDLEILCRERNESEPTVEVILYQCLPKGDKMDGIVKRCVELGVHAVVPVLSRRCVSRPQAAALEKKITRYNQIAYEAAKQSGRGTVPKVCQTLSLEEALNQIAAGNGCPIFLYEEEHKRSLRTLSVESGVYQVVVGPEGGFDREEVALAKRLGIEPYTLGPRILRTETAGACALTVLMTLTNNL